MFACGLPGGSGGKESACNAGDPGSIPGSGRSPGEGMATHSNILFGESHGQRSLVSYSPWGHKQLNMIEATEHVHTWFMLTLNLVIFLK